MEVIGSDLHCKKVILPVVFSREDKKGRAGAGRSAISKELDLAVMAEGRCLKH